MRYWQRVAIRIQVRRVLVYDGTSAPPRVAGDDLPRDDPASQSAPTSGTGPRVDTANVAAHLDRLPHPLLGWVGSDGLPIVTRVHGAAVDENGVRLASTDVPLPAGNRRAGVHRPAEEARVPGAEEALPLRVIDYSQARSGLGSTAAVPRAKT